jgi:hypothetical protein
MFYRKIRDYREALDTLVDGQDWLDHHPLGIFILV